MRRPRFERTAFTALVLALASLPGCGAGTQAEQTGAEMRQILPDDLAPLLPAEAILCHRESTDQPMPYRLWILRQPGGRYLDYPKGLKDFERHDMPSAILERLLKAKLPGTESGPAPGGSSRYTHWISGDREYRVREMITERGWFASVEQFTGS